MYRHALDAFPEGHREARRLFAFLPCREAVLNKNRHTNINYSTSQTEYE